MRIRVFCCEGAIKDSVVGEERLGRYLLAFLNSRQAPLKWKKSIEEARAKEEKESKILVEKSKPKTLLELKRQAYLAQKKESSKKKERVTDHNKVPFFPPYWWIALFKQVNVFCF